MSQKTSKAVSEILRLQRTFTLDELQSAITAVREGRTVSETKPPLRENAAKQVLKRKPVERSVAVAALQKTDPTKFEYLAGLEDKIRKREVLSSPRDLLRFCQMLDKSFVPRKKRDDSISALMKALVLRPLEDLRMKIPDALRRAASEDDDAYQQLAQKLIRPHSEKDDDR